MSQNGNGIFSILLPMLASTIIPALIKKKGKGNNSIFFEMKIKYPELFKRENYPLSNIL